MKFILFLLGTFCLTSSNVYEYSITTLDNQVVSLQSFSGKKIAILTVPGVINHQDSIVLEKIDSLSQAGGQNLKIIVIPRFEDGVSDSNTLSAWYGAHLPINITKSKALPVSRASSNQSGLFNWLCSKDLNSRFDRESVGHWDAFIINERGELQGIINNYDVVSLRKIKILLGL